jgi:transcription factor C subunit 6
MYDDMTGRNFELYLAVATLDPATQPNRTGGLAPDLKGALQIWTVSPGSGINETGLRGEFFDAANDADMKCSLVLCIEGGPIIDFKWMPVGCCDEVSLSKCNSFGYDTEFYITGRV